MKTLGIDIGTTTISAVVLEAGRVVSSLTVANDSFIETGHTWEKIQDPGRILDAALSLVSELTGEHPDTERIGVTGQQHGILYLDRSGEPVSPLYTWQDGRGSLPYKGEKSYASYLSEASGERLSTGFGLVTHFYNRKNGLVPETAVVFCTVADYTAMKLSGLKTPAVHPSNAASFGLFDLKLQDFRRDILTETGIDPSILPPAAVSACIGMYRDTIPVYTAIGDNQASFLGSTQGAENCMLVNIGTGAQVSVYSRNYIRCESLETRPFLDHDYLLAGSSLCGGKAYALLETFFRKTAEMALGHPVRDCYAAMSHMLDLYPEPDNLPVMEPFFQGTRIEPDRRACITGLSPENFLPLPLIYATMHGMVEELYSMYESYIKAGNPAPSVLYGSGNGLRLNPHLCKIAESRFRLPLTLSANKEEAACGAALFAEKAAP